MDRCSHEDALPDILGVGWLTKFLALVSLCKEALHQDLMS